MAEISQAPLSIHLDPLAIRLERTVYEGVEDAWRIVTAFLDLSGNQIAFFEYPSKDAAVTVLSDGGVFMRRVDQQGLLVKPQVLQFLVNSYGLKVSQDLMVYDDSKGPIDVRIARFVQCLLALDGVLRMWQASAPIRF